jgi:hypothetical protein
VTLGLRRSCCTGSRHHERTHEALMAINDPTRPPWPVGGLSTGTLGTTVPGVRSFLLSYCVWIPELEMVKPRPVATVQVTPSVCDTQVNGPWLALWP